MIGRRAFDPRLDPSRPEAALTRAQGAYTAVARKGRRGRRVLSYSTEGPARSAITDFGRVLQTALEQRNRGSG